MKGGNLFWGKKYISKTLFWRGEVFHLRLPRGFLGLCEGGPLYLIVLNTQMNMILCFLLMILQYDADGDSDAAVVIHTL